MELHVLRNLFGYFVLLESHYSPMKQTQYLTIAVEDQLSAPRREVCVNLFLDYIFCFVL